jgi:UDP-N-acetylmuramoyl-tripeptide--D-alanyl-D-alanine ligase
MNKQEIIQETLKFFAGRILKKYKPRVIGITGSVGKSTAKEMISSVLAGAGFSIRRSEKNYNNEIGIPLTIIGATGEKKNMVQWVGIVCKAITLIIIPSKYPEILVLELAVDYPGDMKYFCDFIPIEVGVLTNVGISHLENFGTQEAILKEKSYLLKQSKKAIIYEKNGLENKLQNITLDKIITYGFEKGDFQITEVGYNYDNKNVLSGMIFKVVHKDKIVSGRLNNLVGRPYLYGVLAALSTASYFNIDLASALRSLEDVAVIPGHMSLLKGNKRTSLIDDTYNSAPASVEEALAVIEEVESDRKIVALGDMLELGQEEESSHRAIGGKLATIEGIVFIAVGNRMKVAFEEFKNNIEDYHGRAYWFKSSVEAGRAIQDMMKQGDLVLVKGSQGMRMEKVVIEIMAEPNRRKELIVRQNKDWQG